MSTICDIITGEGVEASGLGHFYAARAGLRWGGITGYDETIFKYLLSHCRRQRIIDVGAGIGTLAASLALNGVTTIAVDASVPRIRAARVLRSKLLVPFPELGERYEIVQGFFPEALHGLNWLGPDVTVVCTNIGAGLDDTAIDRMIDWSRQCGRAIIDLRLFGRARESEIERQELFDHIASFAKSAHKVRGIIGHFAHFKFLGD